MTIPISGSGHQIGSGNINEPLTSVQGNPTTATSTATLTTTQVLSGVVVANPSTTAATYTLPTVADLETALGNIKVNMTFDITIINLGTSTGIITMAAGTGWTLVGMATLPITTAAGSSATFRCRKTGTGTWTAYRIS